MKLKISDIHSQKTTVQGSDCADDLQSLIVFATGSWHSDYTYLIIRELECIRIYRIPN